MAEAFIDYTMSVNDIQRPIILKKKDAIYTLLVRIALLEPGTNEAFPEMGLGLRNKWRYSLQDRLTALVSEYRKQINTYLPDLISVDIKAEIKQKVLHLNVNINDQIIYPIIINTETMTLQDL